MGFLPPLISATFPQATPGPHKSLGYAFIRSTPQVPFQYPSPTYPTAPPTPALKIEEIAYAVYYPCTPSKGSWFGGPKSTVSWLPSENVVAVVKGYERFLGKTAPGWVFTTLRYVAARLKIPAYPLAPLESTITKYPLVIFSHGLAGTRNAYSQYCSAIASQGYVVLALEHRDGSGPAISLPPLEGSNQNRTFEYIKHEELDFSGSSEKSLTHFRTLQLDIRSREIYEAYYSFKRLISAEGDPKTIVADIKAEAKDKWIGSFRDMVDVQDLSLTGHSFGAGTILHILQTPPPAPDILPSLPINRAIALDPWLEPIPLPSSSTKASSDMPPILVINSDGFTKWTDHYQRLLKMMKQAQGSLVTIIGANHQAFSDFLILVPPSPSTALSQLATMHQLSISFLRNRLPEATCVKGKQPDGGRYKKDKKGGMEGAKGEVVVHLWGRGVEA